ncbi:hypothetical protein [Vibrio quintilis]|uniref:3-phosphoshikimate 1-carboxyvinyltransferase n=1 Tax=Vibrio quintilis TaxID=1117707 RepID=A0A1M7Z0Y0_9VIBR|nr:hypothetical protein [Vibrio quintilis]SHO58597.1 hypothetical protein VQ7734_04369 [Vibrio quintilis]
MTESKSKVADRFWQILNPEVAADLDEEQRAEIERTVDIMCLSGRHSVDVRKTVPWIGKRYYLVFLAGRDRRQHVRGDKLKLTDILLAVFIAMVILTTIGLALLALYLIKSALGIDVFKNFSFGIWDWFQGLYH